MITDCRCKIFITQLIQFPVIIFLWSNLGKVIDKNLKEECATQFTLIQLLESIISNEFPHIKFALKVYILKQITLPCIVILNTFYNVTKILLINLYYYLEYFWNGLVLNM